MNVLLINPPYRTRGVPPIMPIHLTALGSYLKEHHHGVEIVDLNVVPWERLTKRIHAGDFDLTAISHRNVAQAFWLERFRGLRRLVRSLQDEGARNLIVGGPGFSLFYPLIFRHVPEIRLGVIGEGERSLLRFAEGDALDSIPGIAYRANGEIRVNAPAKPLSGEEIPCLRDIDGFDYAHPDYLVGFQTYRGCAYQCFYCPIETMRGQGIALRPINRVEEDLIFLRGKNIRHLFFIDGVFNVPCDRSIQLTETMTRLGYPETWEGFLKPRSDIDEAYLKRLADSGAIRLHVDVLSMTESIGPAIGHGLTPREVFRVASLMKKVGIEGMFYFSYLLPGEKWSDEARTIGHLRKIHRIGHKTYIWPFFAFPGTGSEKFYGDILQKTALWHIVRTIRMIIRPSFILFTKNFLTFAKWTRRINRRGPRH